MKQLTISNNKLTSRDNQSFVQYLKEVSAIKLLTPEEEIILTEKVSNGDEEALEELVKKNLRFVISVAKQYVTPQNHIEDLVNEGNIGLMMAAKKFDPKSNVKFISYAVWWIRKIIMEHLSKNGRLIRLPANKLNVLTKIERQLNQLEQKLGRAITINEAVESYSLDLDILKDNPIDYEVLSMLSSYSMDSLDRSLNNDEQNSSTLGDTIVSDTFNANDFNLLDIEIKEELNNALNILKPRDKKIMIALFGLDGSIPRTLKDVGDEIGVTREMVRQIKEKSLVKLKKKLYDSEILE